MEASKITPSQPVGNSEKQAQPTAAQSPADSAAKPSQKARSTAGLFITPVIQFDSESLAVIFRVRDGLSGEVKQEYPQQSVIKGRQATAEAAARRMEPSGTEQGANPSSLQTVGAEANSVGEGVRVQSEGGSQSPSVSNSVATSTVGIADGLGNT
ncbi:MAG: hypothetical protein CMM58_09715 [Rhodospirillaceae bacterium]|nr:hypothetical protein [Rhodospirillaceae bacterium]